MSQKQGLWDRPAGTGGISLREADSKSVCLSNDFKARSDERAKIHFWRSQRSTPTKNIKPLPEPFGVARFERLPRGVSLTSCGATLPCHAESVHARIKDAWPGAFSARARPWA